MKRKILTIITAIAICILFTGCAGSTDAFARLEILPKTKVTVGPGAAEVQEKVIAADIVNNAMREGVVTDAEGLQKTYCTIFGTRN